MEVLVGHVLVDVNPCGRCEVVAPLPQIAKLPQKTIKKRIEDVWADLSRYITPLLNKGNIFFIWRWFEWRFEQKTNLNLISIMLPLKTTIDIPIIISYTTKLQPLKYRLWVIASNMQTSIRLDLSWEKKLQILSYGRCNWGHIFLSHIWGKLDVGSQRLRSRDEKWTCTQETLPISTSMHYHPLEKKPLR